MASKDRFREAERVLRIAGFYLAAQNGHHKWVHPDGRIFIVRDTYSLPTRWG